MLSDKNREITDSEEQNKLKIKEQKEVPENTSMAYQQEKRLDNAKPFDELDKDMRETQEKKSEIVENMVTKDFPISAEKRLDNTKDFHYLHEEKFGEELKHRDSSVTGQDIRDTAGFHDGRDNQAFVKDDGNTLATSIHEKLHQKSQSDLPVQFREGLTEHFSREEAGAIGRLKDIDHSGKEIPKPLYYEKEVEIVKKLEATIGREPLHQAYFEGKTAELRNHVDGILGEGSYEKITDALERKDYKTASEIIEKYYKK